MTESQYVDTCIVDHKILCQDLINFSTISIWLKKTLYPCRKLIYLFFISKYSTNSAICTYNTRGNDSIVHIPLQG